MGIDAVLGTAMRLNTSVEALAVLGARLRLDLTGAAPDPAVAPLLDAVLAQLGLDPTTLTQLTHAERQAALGGIQAFLRQAQDLIDHAGRPPGWTYEDPAVLQSQGRGSMSFARIVREVAPALDGLSARLASDDAVLLDIGTGVGWLAIAMAAAFPGLRAVGLDVWTPALTLARQNVADAGLGDRITLRHESITELADREAYALAWIPGPFLPEAVARMAILRTHQALEPGGWAFFGLYAGPDDPLATTLTDLRIVRSGGHPARAPEIVAAMTAAGYRDVRTLARTWQAPIALVVGRR